METELEQGDRWARVWIDATHNQLVIQRGVNGAASVEHRQGGNLTVFGTPDLDYLGQLKQRALQDLKYEGFRQPQGITRFYG